MKLTSAAIIFTAIASVSALPQSIWQPPPGCNYNNAGECRASVRLNIPTQNRVVAFQLDYLRCTNFDRYQPVFGGPLGGIGIQKFEVCKIFPEKFCKGDGRVLFFKGDNGFDVVPNWNPMPNSGELSILCKKSF